MKLADTLRALLLEDETGLALLLAVRLELRRGDPAAAELLLDQLPQAARDDSARPPDAAAAVPGGAGRGPRRPAAGAGRGPRRADRAGPGAGPDGWAGAGVRHRDPRPAARRPRGAAGAGRAAADARQLFGWLERTRAQVYRYEPLPAIDDPVLAEQVSSLRSLRRAAQQARLAGRSPRREEKRIVALEREVVRQGWYASPWGRPRPVASLAEVMRGAGRAGAGDVRGVRRRAGGRGGRRWPGPARRLASATETFEWAKRLHADLDTYAPNGLPPQISKVVGGSARRSADVVDARLVVPLRPVHRRPRAGDRADGAAVRRAVGEPAVVAWAGRWWWRRRRPRG